MATVLGCKADKPFPNVSAWRRKYEQTKQRSLGPPFRHRFEQRRNYDTVYILNIPLALKVRALSTSCAVLSQQVVVSFAQPKK